MEQDVIAPGTFEDLDLEPACPRLPLSPLQSPAIHTRSSLPWPHLQQSNLTQRCFTIQIKRKLCLSYQTKLFSFMAQTQGVMISLVSSSYPPSPELNTSDDTNSDDTNSKSSEACLLEMLGLDSIPYETTMTTTSELPQQTPPPQPITFPPRCHRLPNLLPSQCFALHLPSHIPPSITSSIRSLAHPSYRYVTEASHRTVSSSSPHTVNITTPNPHKVTRIPSRDNLLPILTSLILSDSTINAIETSSFYARIKPTLHSQLMRLNPRLRCVRYDSSNYDHFPPHFDAVTDSPGGPGWVWRSYITVLLYLNDVEGGGRTIFRPQVRGPYPRAGVALLVCSLFF